MMAHHNSTQTPSGFGSTRNMPQEEADQIKPNWGTARLNERTRLVVVLRDENVRLPFNASDFVELIIGREDLSAGVVPDINLSPFDGFEKGVSRRHAMIQRRDGSLNLIDLGSGNGTFLNGQRLVAGQPRVLRDGDDVRLGKLVLRVAFEVA